MAKKPKGPDYEGAKAAYLRGGHENSIRNISSKFGIPQGTLSKRAAAEGWTKLRKETAEELGKILPSKVADAIATEAAEWTKESLRLARMARDLIGKRSTANQVIVGFGPDGPSKVQVDFLNAPRDVKDWITALTAADKMGRLALGLKDGGTPSTGDNPLTALVQAIQRSKKRAECSSGPTSPPSS